MTNIFLTRRCNLSCPYCFADEFVNKDSAEISLENFEFVLNFIKSSKKERIGLIGGEPTLHSSFEKIMKILISDDEVNDVIVYTNGLEIDKYLDLFMHEKIALLINCNSPSDLGDKLYEKLKRNISLLSENKKEKYTLGINLYSENMDYGYIFELLKIANHHSLRFSTALPNTEKEETVDVLNCFIQMKPLLMQFFSDCIKNDVSPNSDCNAIPDCVLSAEDRKILLKLAVIASKYQMVNTINTCHICQPVIDILPDLTAVRCFGLSKYMKVPIKSFKSINKLRDFFYNKVDLYARMSFLKAECEDCKSRLYNRCGICFTFKLKQIEKIKKLAVENSG